MKDKSLVFVHGLEPDVIGHDLLNGIRLLTEGLGMKFHHKFIPSGSFDELDLSDVLSPGILIIDGNFQISYELDWLNSRGFDKVLLIASKATTLLLGPDISLMMYTYQKGLFTDLISTILKVYGVDDSVESEEDIDLANAIDVTIEIPEDMSEEDVLKLVSELSQAIDDEHRNAGGDGVKLADSELITITEKVPEPHV